MESGEVNRFHLASEKKSASVMGRIDVHQNYEEDITRRREDSNFIFEW